MRKHVAIDLGAESGRIIVGDARAVETVHRFANVPVRVRDALYWDTLGLWSEIKAGLKIAFARYPGEVSSVGLDTWGVDYGLFDSRGELVGNPYHYRDARTDSVAEELFRIVSKREVYGVTGIQFMQINTLYQLFAFSRQQPELYRSAAHFLHTPDLFTYWLTGEMKNEYSIATTSQLFDPTKREWAVDLMARLGLRSELFKEIVMPGTVIGPLLPAVAQETGAPSGVVVIASGCHDTASAVAAVPASGRDYAYLSSGTWSLLGVESERPIITDKSFEYNFTNEGAADGGIRFLKNIMGLWIVQECKRSWDLEGSSYSYADLSRLAEEHGPAGFSIDPDAPRFLKPGLTSDGMPERIRQWCRETGQPVPESPQAIVRGVLESLAATYRKTVAMIEEISGRTFRELYIIGGGSQNALLCRLAADATGLPVLAGPVEATAIGNIMIQQIAQGEISSIEEGRKIVRESHAVRRYDPASGR